MNPNYTDFACNSLEQIHESPATPDDMTAPLFTRNLSHTFLRHIRGSWLCILKSTKTYNINTRIYTHYGHHANSLCIRYHA